MMPLNPCLTLPNPSFSLTSQIPAKLHRAFLCTAFAYEQKEAFDLALAVARMRLEDLAPAPSSHQSISGLAYDSSADLVQKLTSPSHSPPSTLIIMTPQMTLGAERVSIRRSRHSEVRVYIGPMYK